MLINCVAMAGIGFMMGTIGYGYNTKEYWIVTALCMVLMLNQQ